MCALVLISLKKHYQSRPPRQKMILLFELSFIWNTLYIFIIASITKQTQKRDFRLNNLYYLNLLS